MGIVGCTAVPPAADLTTLVGLAEGDWRRVQVAAGPYVLAGAYKQGEDAQPLTVYLEGDGRAYAPTGAVSDDPTPSNPVGAKLALRDGGRGSALYLARPCQFVGKTSQPVCANRAVFTTQRWSAGVVEAYVQALTPYIIENGVRLVGYSGGAYIALAVASRLPVGTVREIVTVAGNLNPNAVHKAHKVPLLADVAGLEYGRLAGIPQLHKVGTKDTVIPTTMKDTYMAEAGEVGRQAVEAGVWRWESVEAGHGEGW
ncbi:MAG: hypothetical protein WAZ18_01050 [Alphaproteobacteria bacterium]